MTLSSLGLKPTIKVREEGSPCLHFPFAMKTSSKALWASALLLFAASCKRQEQQSPQAAESASNALTEDKVELSQGISNQAEVGNAALIESSETVSGYRSWIGKPLGREDKNLFKKWVEDLSRNPNEKLHREHQLAHLVRAEVLAWNISRRDLEPTQLGDEPQEVELPFFEDQTLTVIAQKIHHYGEQSVNLRGHLANDPKSKVHLNLSNQSPTVLIEGPNNLYYYESFEDVVILREDEPGSHLEHSHPHPHGEHH